MGAVLKMRETGAGLENSKPDAQISRMIASALAAGLKKFKITKRGRELTLEVQEGFDPETDDVEARIARMMEHAE